MKTAKFTRFYDSEEGLRMEKKKLDTIHRSEMVESSGT